MLLVEASAAYPRNDESSVIALSDGRILVVWSRFHHLNRAEGDTQTFNPASGLPGTALNSDNAPSDIAAVESADGGETWSGARVLVSNSAGLNVMNPGLARLGDGGLGLLYNFRESTRLARRMFCRSDDEGRTWSQPVAVTQDGYQTGCNDRLTVLSSGRLLTALHITEDWHSHFLYTRVARSDDHGTSWTLSAPIRLPRVDGAGESGAWEGDLTERADGSVLLVLRTAMGTLFRAESHDSGETWHGLRSLEVVSPVAPGIVRRIPGTDRLLLIWNWHYDIREPMSGIRRPLARALSVDGGDSFPSPYRRIIEDDPAYTYAYPSCTFINHEVWITYYVASASDPFGARSLKLMRLPLKSLIEE
jgi:hypothetical protein